MECRCVKEKQLTRISILLLLLLLFITFGPSFGRHCTDSINHFPNLVLYLFLTNNVLLCREESVRIAEIV